MKMSSEFFFPELQLGTLGRDLSLGPRQRHWLDIDYIISTGFKTEQGCIERRKNCNAGNYPCIRIGWRTIRLSRWLLALQGKLNLNDPILCALHTCDNTRCINPQHIYAGTHEQNMLDKKLRNRNVRGDAHYRCRITDAQIKEMREMYALGIPINLITYAFNVDRSYVYRIVRGLHR